MGKETLILCPDCKEMVSKNAKTCPHCGVKIKKSHKLLIFLGILGALYVIGTLAPDSTTTSSNSNTSSPAAKHAKAAAKQVKLELLKGWEITTGEFGNSVITGKVKNNTSKEYSYVQITFNLYDGSHALVGTALANVNHLEPNSVWKFKAACLQEDFKTAKFKELTGF